MPGHRLSGPEVRALREAAGLSQEQLAERSSLSIRTVRNIEASAVTARPTTAALLHAALAQAADHVAADRSSLPVPVRMPTQTPMQLPAAPEPFAGRERELALFDRLLDERSRTGAHAAAPAVVVVTGPPGIGKTAFMRHTARRVASRFPDGQLHADLHGFSGSLGPVRSTDVLGRFLHAVGLAADVVPEDPEERAALWSTVTAERGLLILLDDAASTAQVRSLLGGGPGSLILVTSRCELGGLLVEVAAERVALEPLSPDASVAVLRRLLGARANHSRTEDLTALAQRCGHLPLALRLAGALLAVHPRTPVQSLAGELAEGRGVSRLVVPDGVAEVGLATAFDRSYLAVPTHARWLFQRLGLVPGADISLDAVAALLDQPLDMARTVAGALTSAHLLEEPVPHRFRMHDLMRCYAADRARAAGIGARDAGLGRLLDYYLLKARAASQALAPQLLRLPASSSDAPFLSEERALAWLDEEHANLAAVVEVMASDPHRGDVSWRLADSLRGYFWHRKQYDEWAATARHGERAATAAGDTQARAAMASSLGTLSWSRGRYREAKIAYARAVTLARRARWSEGEAGALGNLGGVQRNLGKLSAAASLYRRALSSHEANGSARGRAVVLANLASLSFDQGRPAEALTFSGDALRYYVETGSAAGQGRQLLTMGHVHADLGDLREAGRHLDAALHLLRIVGSKDGEADCLNNLARVAREDDRTSPARELIAQAEAILVDMQDRGTECDVLTTTASLDLQDGNADSALALCDMAISAAHQVGYSSGTIEARTWRSAAWVSAGSPYQAIVDAGEALALATRTGHGRHIGYARLALATAHLAAGDTDEATQQARLSLHAHVHAKQRGAARRARELLDRMATIPA